MVKKKRILVIHNSYQIRGGEDFVFQNEVEMLRKAGYTVETYTRSNSEIACASVWKRLKIAMSSFFSVKTYQDVNRIIKEKKIEILHVHNTFFVISPSVYFCAFRNKIPVVQTIHNFRMVCPNGLLLRDGKICEECLDGGLRCALRHQCYRNSRSETLLMVLNIWFYRFFGVYRKINYIFLSDYNREKIINTRRLEKIRISKSHYFVKTNYVKDVQIYETCIENMQAPYFLYCGRLSEEKGILTLMKAWKVYKNSFEKSDNSKEKCQLVVLGDGQLMQQCKEIAIDIGDDSVLLLGATENEIARRYMKFAIATIVPSECYEGCSLTPLEAFSQGCPVIGSDIGNIGLTVKEGVNGYHFEAGNPQDLAEVIDYVLKHSDEEIRTGAYKTFTQYYSEEKNLKLLEEIYAKVCGEI